MIAPQKGITAYDYTIKLSRCVKNSSGIAHRKPATTSIARITTERAQDETIESLLSLEVLKQDLLCLLAPQTIGQTGY